MKNNYHPSFIDKFIKSFLNKLYGPNVIVQNLPKRNAPVKLLLCCYYGKTNHHFKFRFSSFEDFSILTKKINDYKLKIMETLQTAGDKSVLNKADSSLPLELFICNISGYVLSHHMMSICPIVRIQLPFVQFSALCY